MIYLFCLKVIYNSNKLLIDTILDTYNDINITFILLDIENEMYNYIIKNNTIYKNNIYISELNENILKTFSNINECDNFYLFNIKKLDNTNNDYSYINKYNVNILDYDINNILILKQYTKNNNISLIYIKTNIIKDIAVIGQNDELKNTLVKKLIMNNLKVDIIDNNNLNEIYKYKIIINIDYDIDICIDNKNVIIQNKTNTNNTNNNMNITNYNYTIDTNYDSIPIFVLFAFKNYTQINTYVYKNIDTNANIIRKIDKKDNYGFIIVRHVNSEETNNYWIESYNCIRKYYKNKILIIDDNSNYKYITLPNNLKIFNCDIIQTEYNQRGEILGYYYFYKNRPFEKAIIIHDAVFINKYIDFNNYGDIKFLWQFDQQFFYENLEDNLMNILSNNQELKEYYNKRDLIHGCFGVMSVINHSFITKLVDKYNMFKLLNVITNRDERMNFERIFALMCINEDQTLITDPSILGDIHKYVEWGYSYKNYIEDKKKSTNPYLNKDIIKIWTGR